MHLMSCTVGTAVLTDLMTSRLDVVMFTRYTARSFTTRQMGKIRHIRPPLPPTFTNLVGLQVSTNRPTRRIMSAEPGWKLILFVFSYKVVSNEADHLYCVEW
jgi:hypothetical protein